MLLRCLLIMGLVATSVSTLAGDAAATRWPIVLSHHWSESAAKAFAGTEWGPDGYTPMGVKQALEAEGAVVYQPDKVPFGANEVRGRLLYKKCAGRTLTDMLCEGENPQVIDGVLPAMEGYCSDPNQGLAQFPSAAQCLREVKINIICHSQGCPDSRYMIAAIQNELSGKPMHQHVASWTSVAGINKGTPLADLWLGLVPRCSWPDCKPGLLEASLAIDGFFETGYWLEGGHESVVALSRKYMTRTMDIWCNPRREECPPSFNQAYPNHPDIYYQSYSSYLSWIHSCYADKHLQGWFLVGLLEGRNDGWVSLDSQRFLTAGDQPDAPPTYVVDRGIVRGTSNWFWLPHPGISHMGFTNDKVPGLGERDCLGFAYDPDVFHWDREAFYLDVVKDLKAMGY
ncbi:MAG: hypothetical protein SV765_13615 [Pseudomonadota bacterium]|nr:hypothetical protein [Pseudomonadota bacterium]